MAEEFQIEDGLLVKYRGPGGQVIIPAGVTAIRNNALSECGPLTSVTFPEGVRRVGEMAFNNQETLTQVFAPSLEEWLAIDFQGVRSNPLSNGARLYIDGEEVVHLRIPASTPHVGQRAFEGCTSLKSVELPEGLCTIGKLAFGSCPQLRDVTLPQGLEEIGYGSFRSCSLLAAVDYPSSLRRICSWAFAQCTSLVSVELPEGLQKVERDAFCHCTGIRHVRLPRSLTQLPDDAFYGCSSLGSLRIPAEMAVFGSNVFTRCGAITQVHLEGKAIPDSFQPPASLQVLIAPDLQFSSCSRNDLQQALAAGFVKLAATDGTPLTPDCAAYVEDHVPQLLEALDFDHVCVRWFLSEDLIPAGQEANFATMASAAGQMEASALLLDAAFSAPSSWDSSSLEL